MSNVVLPSLSSLLLESTYPQQPQNTIRHSQIFDGKSTSHAIGSKLLINQSTAPYGFVPRPFIYQPLQPFLGQTELTVLFVSDLALPESEEIPGMQIPINFVEKTQRFSELLAGPQQHVLRADIQKMQLYLNFSDKERWIDSIIDRLLDLAPARIIELMKLCQMKHCFIANVVHNDKYICVKAPCSAKRGKPNTYYGKKDHQYPTDLLDSLRMQHNNGILS